MKDIRLDFEHFKDQGQLPNLAEVRDKVEKYHRVLLEGKDAVIKDREVPMTGWKTESPFISDEDLDTITAAAKGLRQKIDDYISIGIGGSYLGIKASIEALVGPLDLINLEKGNIPRIFFLGNHMDPSYTDAVLKLTKGRKVGVCVISKSGGTVEPAIAFAVAKGSANTIIAITDENKGALHDLAKKEKYETFPVPDNVGGRYSVTSPVGLFGMAVAGIDIKEFIAGARYAEEQTRKNKFDKNIAMLRAAMRFIAYDKWDKKIEVASTGIFDLKGVTYWMQQLGPETEGKDGKGLWISPEFYTQDAHANGQMIQQGERNMIETFLMLEDVETDITISARGTPVECLDGKTMSFVNRAFVEGLRDAHFEGGVPCMSYNIPELSANTLGQLYQYEMNAIALGGLLLGLNPFVQPGVQMYKDIANKKSGGK
ncbi:MAG: glucose-6-phosphate isomerase [Candidatus Margulisiibacteriota bacterium]